MSTAAPNELSRIAAVNNAEWCASVWRSHGLKIEQSEGLWFCRSETPRFYPPLLEDGRVTILARTDRDQRIVAGAIAFDQGGVAGLTNVFGAAQGLFGAVSGYTSARALVAYEPGVSVEDSAKRGFRPLARLAVWKRPRLKVA